MQLDVRLSFFTVNPGQITKWDSGFLIEVYSELFANVKFPPLSSTAIQSRIFRQSLDNARAGMPVLQP